MSSADRFTAALGALVGAADPTVDYRALYRARVVTQRADGSLDVRPDDSRLPSLCGVGIKYGLPGVTLQVAGGASVLVGWENGDPQRPFALCWDTSPSSLKLVIDCAALFLGGELGAEPTLKATTYRGAENDLITALTAAISAINAYAVAIQPTADPPGASTTTLTTALMTTWPAAVTTFLAAAAAGVTLKAKVT